MVPNHQSGLIPMKSPFSYGFPIKSPFSHGFPMVFPWFSHGFPLVFPWFSYGFPINSTKNRQVAPFRRPPRMPFRPVRLEIPEIFRSGLEATEDGKLTINREKIPRCEPWCWNMDPNICPCPKSPSFVGKYTSTMVRIWDMGICVTNSH